jgi:hypothetical protein
MAMPRDPPPEVVRTPREPRSPCAQYVARPRDTMLGPCLSRTPATPTRASTHRPGLSCPPYFASQRKSLPRTRYKSRKLVPARACTSPHFLLVCASLAAAAITATTASCPSHSLLARANPSRAFPMTRWSLHHRFLSRFRRSFTGVGTQVATAIWLRRACSPATPPPRPCVGIELR